MEESRSKLRWFQFSLRGLLIFVAVCAALLGLGTTVGVEIIRDFVGLAYSLGFLAGAVLAVYSADLFIARLPLAFRYALVPLVYFVLTFGVHLLAGAVDQPHTTYALSHWFSIRLNQSVSWGIQFAIVILILVALDIAIQTTFRRSYPKDAAYYPRLPRLCTALSFPGSRFVLIFGALLLFGYYASTVIDLYGTRHQPGGLVWPPERVFVCCMFGWGGLWIADCLSRPHRGTLWVAVAFLLCNVEMLHRFAFSILRE